MVAKVGILVTRPSGQADNLCAAIAAAGFSAHHLPMLQLQPLPEPTSVQRQCLLELDRCQHLIFISSNAVRFGMAWIESFWPQLPTGLEWFAVGDATAALLSDFGVSAHTPGMAMNSEGLLVLPELQHVNDHRVLIIKGEGGRDALATTLRARGARVEELVCYRRVPPALETAELVSKLEQWGIQLAMLSSGEGLAHMLALLRPAETTKFTHIKLLVPSERVAQMARDAGLMGI